MNGDPFCAKKLSIELMVSFTSLANSPSEGGEDLPRTDEACVVDTLMLFCRFALSTAF
eukprot:Gb_35144 [translate_table: standard]